MDCKHNAELLPGCESINPLPEGTCPVDWAKKSVDTARLENCGKSLLCRDGLTQIGLIIDDIVSGGGKQEDLALLRELCDYILKIGGCGIACKAAENVLYSLNCYSETWDQHCRRKRCEALVCKAYYHVYCMPEKCNGCTACIPVCPKQAISGGGELTCFIDEERCSNCGQCIGICPQQAIGKYGAVKPRVPQGPVAVGSSAQTPQAGNRRRRR
ncbi:MAG: 4Fe-4S binding protein [Parasporobacterium sp.]|nr:4Fe-4S binding protein [Parasporobacterium sp.]